MFYCIEIEHTALACDDNTIEGIGELWKCWALCVIGNIGYAPGRQGMVPRGHRMDSHMRKPVEY